MGIEQASLIELPFGLHIGSTMGTVPTSYLTWLVKQEDYSDQFVKAAAVVVLNSRKLGKTVRKSPPRVELLKQDSAMVLPAPRSGHIDGETAWQKGFKDACAPLTGFIQGTHYAIGREEAIADLEHGGTPIGLLDLERKDDVCRINKLCRIATKPVIILKGNTAHTVSPGIDQEAQDVVTALQHDHNCQIMVQFDQKLLWQENDPSTGSVQWSPATSDLARLIQPVLSHDGGGHA